MGLFYTNLTLHGPMHAQIWSCLQELGRTAYISRTHSQYTVVYDRSSEDQDVAAIQEFTRRVSKVLNCPSITCLLHDGDVFMYWLFRSGKSLDSYNSDPDYFNPSGGRTGPAGGNPKKLSSAFGVPQAEQEVRKIFDRMSQQHQTEDWRDDWLASEEFHRRLAISLHMPVDLINYGYYAIDMGISGGQLETENFVRLGDKA